MKLLKRIKRSSAIHLLIFLISCAIFITPVFHYYFWGWMNDTTFNRNIGYSQASVFISTGNRTAQDFARSATIFERNSDLYIWVEFYNQSHPLVGSDFNLTFCVGHIKSEPLPNLFYVNSTIKNSSDFTYYQCKFIYREVLNRYESVINVEDFQKIFSISYLLSYKDMYTNKTVRWEQGLNFSNEPTILQKVVYAFIGEICLFVVPQMIYLFYRKHRDYDQIIDKIAFKAINDPEQNDELNEVLNKHRDILKRIDKPEYNHEGNSGKI